MRKRDTECRAPWRNTLSFHTNTRGGGGERVAFLQRPSWVATGAHRRALSASAPTKAGLGGSCCSAASVCAGLGPGQLAPHVRTPPPLPRARLEGVTAHQNKKKRSVFLLGAALVAARCFGGRFVRVACLLGARLQRGTRARSPFRGADGAARLNSRVFGKLFPRAETGAPSRILRSCAAEARRGGSL